MKLKELYELAIKKGMEADPRGEEEVKKVIEDEKEEYEKLEGKDKEVYDTDRLFNPFYDSRL
ncbi:MAG: NGG1p interacting factor NIF3, partial [Thermoplasmata archaeon]